MTPLVSVVMICRDGDAFLGEAIDSVMAQTFAEWELLIVDDGSSDGSVETARRRARERPDQIFCLAHDAGGSRGMSAARNLGIRHARGRYIALLDCDDVWLPEKLEIQLGLAETHPDVDVVCGPTLYWHSWSGRPAAPDVVRELGVAIDTAFEPPSLLPGLLRNEVNAPATCSVLMRRDAVVTLGGFEEQFASMFEDRAFFAKVYLRAPVYVSGRWLDRYRQHAASASVCAVAAGGYHPRRASDAHRRYLSWVRHFLIENHVDDPAIWQAWAIGMWPYHHPARYRVMSALDTLGMGNKVRAIASRLVGSTARWSGSAQT